MWMLVSIALAIATLRIGLSIRRARSQRRPPIRGSRALHLRLARPAVFAILLGAVVGPLSAFWLRGWSPLGTLHAVLGVLCVVLFLATWRFGHRLEAGDGSAREAHARAGALAVLAAAVAAIAGFVLLP